MDDTLATLATSGAQTIVTLMATDAWQKTKSLVTRIFSHKNPDLANEINGELEESRINVLAADSVSSGEVQQHEIDRWEARLRLSLLDDEAAADLVKELIEATKGQQLIGSAGPADISLRADAKGNARIYQQGQGIQYNG